MKLKIPEGLENSDRKEKLSPTTGQPKLPGITSIAFGEVHVWSKRMAATTRTDTNAMRAVNTLSSIAANRQRSFR